MRKTEVTYVESVLADKESAHVSQFEARSLLWFSGTLK